MKTPWVASFGTESPHMTVATFGFTLMVPVSSASTGSGAAGSRSISSSLML